MRLARFVFLCIMLLIIVGCSRLTGEGFPAGVLYQDEFEADTGNWSLESDLEASANYTNGQLQLHITAPNLVTWVELQERQFDDFVLEVDASQIGGSSDNSYGVIFRVQDPSAYYIFEISGDAYYAFKRLDKVEGGRWVWLTEDWLESAAIRPGIATNRIKIIASGSSFVFYVNGQQVAQAEDSTYSSGAIGLDAGSFHQADVQIAFDNLIIRKP